MKSSDKIISRTKDDSLYGLLSSYKSNNTYFRILVSEEEDSLLVQLTDNPKNFEPVSKDRPRAYRPLRRLEIGVAKASLKYVLPENLIEVLGPLLDFNIQPDKVVITDGLKKNGIYGIETSMKYKMKLIHGVKKIINMSPQKKYEIMEKYLSANQE
ncbi:MAG: hypothetical protein JXA07_00780 [Spirochaetes bacterium]|nr:hypothetical protein [Spirochaetota bacterium]